MWQLSLNHTHKKRKNARERSPAMFFFYFHSTDNCEVFSAAFILAEKTLWWLNSMRTFLLFKFSFSSPMALSNWFSLSFFLDWNQVSLMKSGKLKIFCAKPAPTKLFCLVKAFVQFQAKFVFCWVDMERSLIYIEAGEHWRYNFPSNLHFKIL